MYASLTGLTNIVADSVSLIDVPTNSLIDITDKFFDSGNLLTSLGSAPTNSQV